MQCGAVCCSVVQYVAVWCNVLQNDLDMVDMKIGLEIKARRALRHKIDIVLSNHRLAAVHHPPRMYLMHQRVLHKTNRPILSVHPHPHRAHALRTHLNQ